MGPRHGRSAAIPTLIVRPELNAVGILQLIERDFRFGQSELFALVNARGTTKAEQERKIQLSSLF